MVTIVFTLVLVIIVQNTFLNTQGIRPTLDSSTLKESDVSSSQNLVSTELPKNIAYCTTGVDLDLI